MCECALPSVLALTMSLITKKVNFTKQLLKARYTSFKQTTVSTQAAKTKRYHKQNHERPFTERVFTPLNEQIDKDTGVVFYFILFMKPMITSM